MDRAFNDLIDKVSGKHSVVFSLGRNTTFNRQGDVLIVRYQSDNGQVVEHRLKAIEELVEGNEPFESSDDDWMDKYLPLLTAVETAIDARYKDEPGLNDKTVLTILERLVNKPDMRMDSPLADDIRANLRLILSTMRYSRKELVGSLRKVLKSVKRHHSVNGPTGYLEFISRSFAKAAAGKA